MTICSNNHKESFCHTLGSEIMKFSAGFRFGFVGGFSLGFVAGFDFGLAKDISNFGCFMLKNFSMKSKELVWVISHNCWSECLGQLLLIKTPNNNSIKITLKIIAL